MSVVWMQIYYVCTMYVWYVQLNFNLWMQQLIDASSGIATLGPTGELALPSASVAPPSAF